MTSDKVAGGGTARHEVLNEPVTTADSCYLWSLMVFRLRRAVRVRSVGMELPHNTWARVLHLAGEAGPTATAREVHEALPSCLASRLIQASRRTSPERTLSVSDTTNRCYLLRVLTGDVSCITWSRLGEERG